MQTDIVRGTRIVAGPNGGAVDIQDLATGEIVMTIPLSPGLHQAGDLLPLLEPGQGLFVSGHTVAYNAPSRLAVMSHPQRHESAANPSFRVTTAQRQARELEIRMAKQEGKMQAMMAKLMADRATASAQPPLPSSTQDDDPVISTDAADLQP